MLSRRNVRIKVMQVLYAYSRQAVETPEQVERLYLNKLKEAYDLYLYNVLLLWKIAAYSRRDAAIKAAKYIKSEEDMLMTTKLADNPVVLTIEKNENFYQLLKKNHVVFQSDTDFVRKNYAAFAKKSDYKAYLAEEDSTDERHREILLSLYKSLINSEMVEESIEDIFSNWTDDKSLVTGAVKRSIKSLPENPNFFLEHELDKEVVYDFGKELLYIVLRDEEELNEMIIPTLQNWEADRVAVLDMIIIKMALVELLHFSSIPTKVTLNEYVDLAKDYSTMKSNEFVNGILDRLMNKLKEDGRVVKTGRGLID